MEKLEKISPTSEFFLAKPAGLNDIQSAVRKVSEMEQSLIKLHQDVKAQTKVDQGH